MFVYVPDSNGEWLNEKMVHVFELTAPGNSITEVAISLVNIVEQQCADGKPDITPCQFVEAIAAPECNVTCIHVRTHFCIFTDEKDDIRPLIKKHHSQAAFFALCCYKDGREIFEAIEAGRTKVTDISVNDDGALTVFKAVRSSRTSIILPLHLFPDDTIDPVDDFAWLKKTWIERLCWVNPFKHLPADENEQTVQVARMEENIKKINSDMNDIRVSRSTLSLVSPHQVKRVRELVGFFFHKLLTWAKGRTF